MLTNITIGQYYPVDSRIHRLDPRVKLAAAFFYILLLFVVKNLAGHIFVVGCVGLVIYASNIPPRYMFRGIRGILFIILFTVGLNIFFTPGEHVLVSFWIIRITLEGLLLAVRMAARLVLLVVGSSILTLTTSPIQLTDAIEYFLGPFRKIGVPAHEIAMMMTIALRFIPTLLEEMDKIMKAQMARGADFETGGVLKRAKSLIPLLVPLFISAFRRADELSMAMESRCYRGDYNRTKMKVLHYEARDYKAWACIGVFAVIVFLTRFLPGLF